MQQVCIFSTDVSVVCAGLPNASAEFLRQRLLTQRARHKSPWGHVIPALHRVSDVENWQTMRQTIYAATAAAVLVLGHPVIAPPLASTTLAAATAVHIAGQFGQRAISVSTVAVQRILRSSSKAVLKSETGPAGLQLTPRLLQPRRAQQNAQLPLVAALKDIGVASQPLHILQDPWRAVQPLVTSFHRKMARAMRWHLRKALVSPGRLALASVPMRFGWPAP
jgi:hypothetical protein